ncbi:MAG: hypothetical protein A2X86_02700 [Bdellovibrionales bacterium GWA2_49_15]|nr:MAG: hypothetical protein A2X86_02700 [Bdellovibrionales bacterium GWA2_49_15]HAZ14152.1 hypothetical protein [Bdellovibrionales bacterium]
MKFLVLIVGLLLSTMFTMTPVRAQDDMQYEEMDMMNVEGDLEMPAGNSSEKQSERLRKMRVALEKRNEIMIRRKIEQLRVKQEIQMMRQVQRAMNQTMKEMEKI